MHSPPAVPLFFFFVVSLFVHFWPICPLLVSHTHTHKHTRLQSEEKRPYCVQQSICLLQLSNFEDDVRMWQSPLYPPACFITGVIHTKRKCVCAYQCVCVCVCICLFSLAVFWTADHKQPWGLRIVISLVQLSHLQADRHTETHTRTHATFTPLLRTTPTGRVCIWRGCVSVFWRNGGWM